MTYFDPSPDRARACRLAMDESLVRSISQVVGAGDTASTAIPDERRVVAMLDYGAYFDLTLDLPGDAQISEDAKQAARERLRGRFPAGAAFVQASDDRPGISNLCERTYTPAELECLERWWDMEREAPIVLRPASDEMVETTGAAIEIALDHLAAAAPELYGEFLAIVNEIVLAQPEGSSYGGVTSMGLWGGFTLNAENFRTWQTCYGKLVHEMGHNLLFGYAREEPLVLDDPEKRSYSAVRGEMRPYDGIFHAAFVMAREAYAFDRLLVRNDREGSLNADDTELFDTMLAVAVNSFWGCAETLREEATIGKLGDEILTECEEYMRENFAFADA